MNLMTRFLLLIMGPWHKHLQMAVDILMIDLELMLGLSIYNLASDDEMNEVMQRTVLFKLIGWLDVDHALRNLNDSNWVWIFLVLATLMIGSVNVLMALSLRRRKSHGLQESGWTEHWHRLLGGFVYFYQQVFTLMCVANLSIFHCRYAVYIKPPVQADGFIEVYSEQLAVLTDKENILTLVWNVSRSVKCFDGEYIMMATLSAVLLLLSCTLLYFNHRLTSFVGRLDLYESKIKSFDIIYTATFLLLHFIKNLTLNLKLKSQRAYYLAAVVLCYSGLFALFTSVKPYFDRRTLRVKLCKIALTLLVASWSFLCLQLPDSLGEYSASRPTHLSIILLLSLAVLFRLLLAVTGENPHSIFKGIDQTQIVRSIFQFESDKRSLIRSARTATERPEIAAVLTKYLVSLKDHRVACSRVYCPCRTLDTHLELTQLRSFFLEGFVAHSHIMQAIFSMQQIVLRYIRHHIIPSLAHSRECSDVLKTCVVFLLNNFGNTPVGLSLVHSIKHFKRDRSQVWANPLLGMTESLESFAKQTRSTRRSKFRYSVLLSDAVLLEDYVCEKIRKFQDDGSAATWENCLPQVVTSECVRFKEVFRVLKQIDDLTSTIIKGFSIRNDILNLLRENKSRFFEESKRHTSNLKQASALIKTLDSLSKFAYQKYQVLKMVFFIHIKEDYHAAQQSLRDLARKTCLSDLQLVISLRNRQQAKGGANHTIILSISGESETLQKVTYLCENVGIIGHTVTDLLGADLGKLLPAPIAEVHKKLMQSEIAERSHALPRVDPICGAVRCGSLDLALCQVNYRISPTLKDGLEYTGMIELDLMDDAKKRLIIFADRQGRVLDRCQRAKDFFEEGADLHFDDRRYFPDWRENSICVSADGYEDKNGKSCAKSNTCELIRASRQFNDSPVQVEIFKYFLPSDNPNLVQLVVISCRSSEENGKIDRSFANKTSFLNNSRSSVIGLQSPNLNLRKSKPALAKQIATSKSLKQTAKIKLLADSPTNSEDCSDGRQFSNRSKPGKSIGNPARDLGSMATRFSIDASEDAVHHSKFIHHHMSFKGLRILVFGFSIPFLTLFLNVFFGLFYFEHKEIQRYKKLPLDITIFDSEAYIIWLFTRLSHSIILEKFTLTGVLDAGSFAEFGFEDYEDHIVKLVTENDVFDQGVKQYLRVVRSIESSAFADYYDLPRFIAGQVTVRTFNQATGQIELVKMSPFDGLKYTDQWDNRLHSKEYVEYLKDPATSSFDGNTHEEIVYYNKWGPLYHHFITSSCRLPRIPSTYRVFQNSREEVRPTHLLNLRYHRSTVDGDHHLLSLHGAVLTDMSEVDVASNIHIRSSWCSPRTIFYSKRRTI